MKICFINGWVGGSTGNIIKDISFFLERDYNSSACYIYREKSDITKYAVLQLRTDFFSYKLERLLTYFFGNDGFCNFIGTRRAIKFLKKEKPDIIHIHNIHGSFINVDKILKFAHEKKIKVVWTLHDTWLVSGRCCYYYSCNLWKQTCHICPHRNYYPTCARKNVKKYAIKKEEMIKKYKDNITFVSPSNWLKKVVETRYKDLDVEVINNGINQEIFTPSTPNKKIVEMAGGKFIIGAAAYLLNNAKGLDFLKRLADVIDGEKYIIVACGAKNEEIENNRRKNLILLPRINSREEMKSFYTTIDIFLNPTQLDNFPTVNLECISCGAPIICFKVGGAVEMITDGLNGYGVTPNDIMETKDKIEQLAKNKLDRKKIIESSKPFSREIFAKKYINLYKNVLS